jgi:hypothetical protein
VGTRRRDVSNPQILVISAANAVDSIIVIRCQNVN